MSAPRVFANIALALPAPGLFQYSIPEELVERATIGRRVFVRVRQRKMVGTLVDLGSEAVVKEVKDIDEVIEAAPPLGPEFLELTRWMSEYYFCSWGQAIDAALPAPFRRGKFTMRASTRKNERHPEIENPEDLPLTTHQDAVYHRIVANIHGRKKGVFLLYGVTGSGKTEVYMHLIRELLKESRGSIVLVPEISLTPHAVDRFHSRFGDQLAIIHSRLAASKRMSEWYRIRNGEARVVVGARSAVFSPVRDLGLIVIDEEQENSYKQDETPRYHTRDVAMKRVELENAVLVLGSATPSLEAFHASNEGGIERVTLPERIEKRPLPIVDIVDMRRHRDGRTLRIFSAPLEDAVRESLSKKEQVMLLLNRRGFSTYLHCPSCGYVMTCDHCRIALAYHTDKGTLLCHLCHFRAAPPKLCPGCQKNYLHYFGVGTQKVAFEAEKLFPGAKIGRMDADSTARKHSHEDILRAFKKKDIDILIGTQMIAKGHDFPNVSLIGVISADTALYIPDFRAAERTFDLLTQVAGRAGRGDVPGKVLIQTHIPTHYSVQSAKNHDYLGFFEKELSFRRELLMPPFTRMIQIVLSGSTEKEVVRQILGLSKLLREREGHKTYEVLGPAPCLNSKEKGQFRWNIFLKSPDAKTLGEELRLCLRDFKKSGVTLTVNVDPQ